MRLSAIEAVRYGSLENLTVEGFGDGLTVVLGPNESGKSSLTALTRHVLYGFPTKAMKDRGYHSAAGVRSGRLVFEGSDGAWAIERVEGPKGGPCQVVARAGTDRHDLLAQLTSGVTEQTFRVVFGFGIDELKQIESADASDVVARLYAAGAGLGVAPMDVRRRLEENATSLYSRSKGTVNLLVASIRETKERIRAIEAEIAGHARQQLELADLRERLAPLRERRAELEAQVGLLDRSLVQAREALERSTEATALLGTRREEASALAARRALITIDEAVLSAGPALSAVLEDQSGFKAHVAARDSSALQAHGLEAELSADVRFAVDADDSPEARAAVERWRDELATLRGAETSTADAARQAEVRASRLEELASAQLPTQQRVDRRPGIVALSVGLAGAALGLVTGQWLAVVLGVLVAAAGAALLLRRPAETTSPLGDDALRARTEIETTRALATDARDRHAAACGTWGAWLVEHRLDGYGTDPVSVRQLLDDVATHRRRAEEAARCRRDAQREAQAAQQWVDRLTEAVRQFDPTVVAPSAESAPTLAAQARERLETARRAKQEATGLDEELARLGVAVATSESDIARHRRALEEVARACGCDATDPVPQLQARYGALHAEYVAVREECDALSQEAAQLEGKLSTDSKNDDLARARQRLEGLQAQAAAAAERYVTQALAVQLVKRTHEQYEIKRQPEVVRNAQAVFSAMTEGRYSAVRVPTMTGANDGITVIGADGAARKTDQLSRGTAEQLYLALRVGLITSLGDVGASLPVLMDDVLVNFDPDRRRGAAVAVAQLASARQVLFFTCHPETASVLELAVPGTRVIELGRCELR